MQDRYVGDVGDFGKFALLRRLARGPDADLRLGVHWHLFRNESHNGDGRHVGYLGKDPFRGLDAHVHDVLLGLVRDGRRSVAEVASSRLLPPDTLHFLDPTPDADGSSPPAGRIERRRRWGLDAQAALSPADLVFFDPDNGIETASVPPTSLKAGKYVFWDELSAFWKAGQSLVVYHHLNRTASVPRQVDVLRERFAARLGTLPLLSPLIYRRGSCRVFWIVGQERHAEALRSRSRFILGEGWNAHFEQG